MAETRRLVPVSEILGLRIRCGHCGSAIEIAAARFDYTANQSIDSLKVCGPCGKSFHGSDVGLNLLLSVAQTIDQIRRGALGKGCHLEIVLPGDDEAGKPATASREEG